MRPIDRYEECRLEALIELEKHGNGNNDAPTLDEVQWALDALERRYLERLQRDLRVAIEKCKDQEKTEELLLLKIRLDKAIRELS